jgi:hypothetical protein
VYAELTSVITTELSGRNEVKDVEESACEIISRTFCKQILLGIRSSRAAVVRNMEIGSSLQQGARTSGGQKAIPEYRSEMGVSEVDVGTTNLVILLWADQILPCGDNTVPLVMRLLCYKRVGGGTDGMEQERR